MIGILLTITLAAILFLAVVLGFSVLAAGNRTARAGQSRTRMALMTALWFAVVVTAFIGVVAAVVLGLDAAGLSGAATKGVLAVMGLAGAVLLTFRPSWLGPLRHPMALERALAFQHAHGRDRP